MKYTFQFAMLFFLYIALVTTVIVGCGDIQKQMTKQFIERINTEINSRTVEENRREIQGLFQSLRKHISSKNDGRAKDIALEIEVIIKALVNDNQEDDSVIADSPEQTDLNMKRIIEESESRTENENRGTAQGLLNPLKEAMDEKDDGQAKALATEIRVIMEILDVGYSVEL